MIIFGEQTIAIHRKPQTEQHHNNMTSFMSPGQLIVEGAFKLRSQVRL